MIVTEGFVYCWTDHVTGKLYVGAHKGIPTDGYVCSSKPMMVEYKKRPNDFTREVIASGTYADIRKLEAAILQSVGAAKSPEFYNRHNCDAMFYCVWDDAHRAKVKQSNSRPRPDVSERNKLDNPARQSGSREKMRGRKRPDLVIYNNSRLGVPLTEAARAKMSAKRKGVLKTEETKQKMAEARRKYWALKKATDDAN